MASTSGTNPVCLVHLVSLVDLVHLVSPVQPSEQDRLADFFSILPALTITIMQAGARSQAVCPHYSMGFVTKPPRRLTRRARWKQAYLKQYGDRLNGEPARRQACRSGISDVAVEALVNNARKESVRHCYLQPGEGGVARCEAAGLEKPEAYSLEYGEDFFLPRTTQMVSDRSPQ
jgi:hypothetical protein